MKINSKKNKKAQAMVEYILIVTLVALAALAIFAVFGDTIRAKLSGAITEMDSGDHAAAAQAATSKDSKTFLKDLDKDGEK